MRRPSIFWLALILGLLLLGMTPGLLAAQGSEKEEDNPGPSGHGRPPGCATSADLPNCPGAGDGLTMTDQGGAGGGYETYTFTFEPSAYIPETKVAVQAAAATVTRGSLYFLNRDTDRVGGVIIAVPPPQQIPVFEATSFSPPSTATQYAPLNAPDGTQVVLCQGGSKNPCNPDPGCAAGSDPFCDHASQPCDTLCRAPRGAIVKLDANSTVFIPGGVDCFFCNTDNAADAEVRVVAPAGFIWTQLPDIKVAEERAGALGWMANPNALLNPGSPCH